MTNSHAAVDHDVNNDHLHTNVLLVWAVVSVCREREGTSVFIQRDRWRDLLRTGLSEQPTREKRIMAATARALAECNPPVWWELSAWQHAEVPDKLIPGGRWWFFFCFSLVTQHECVLCFISNRFGCVMFLLMTDWVHVAIVIFGLPARGMFVYNATVEFCNFIQTIAESVM